MRFFSRLFSQVLADYCCLGGNCWKRLGKSERALACFNKATILYPSATAYSWSGVLRCELKQYDQAIADLSEAIRLEPKWAGNYWWRAFAWWEKERFDLAIADISRAIELDPKNAGNFALRSRCHLDSGSVDPAIADASEAIRLDPKDAGNYCLRGECYQAKKAYQHAKADFSETLRLRPKELIVQAVALLGVEEYEQAVSVFTKILQCQSQQEFHGLAIHQRGYAYGCLGEYQKSIDDCTELIRIDPNKACFWWQRGIGLAYLREFDRAISDFDTAIRLDAASFDAFHWRACCYYKQEKYPEALADCDELLRLNPRFAMAFAHRGTIAEKSGNRTQANAEYGQAIMLANSLLENEPGNLDALYARGLTCAALQDYAKATADLEQLIALDPENRTDVLSSLAWLLATCPDPMFRDGKRAIQYALKAIELDKQKCAGDLEILAAAHAEAGQFQEAIHWQSKALAMPGGTKNDSEATLRLNLYKERKPYREERSRLW